MQTGRCIIQIRDPISSRNKKHSWGNPVPLPVPNVYSLSFSVCHNPLTLEMYCLFLAPSLLFLLQKICRSASPRTRETSLMDLQSHSPLVLFLQSFSTDPAYYRRKTIKSSLLFQVKSEANNRGTELAHTQCHAGFP